MAVYGMSLRPGAALFEDIEDAEFFDRHVDPCALDSYLRFLDGPEPTPLRPPSWDPDADTEGQILDYVFGK
jgi:hypothetical protein